jgi:phosphopantothenoylcysteine decarboxylase
MSRILLGVTGSVAAIRTPELLAALREGGHEVRLVLTEAAAYFLDPAWLASLSGEGIGAFRDADEWPAGGYRRGDPVLHIELRKWAEALVVAPLDAHTLARFALGLADNLLTCVLRAWEFPRPIVLAPAMNTRMWDHPATRRHLSTLLDDHAAITAPPHATLDDLCALYGDPRSPIRLVPPVEKELACGDVGPGGLAEVAEVVAAVAGALRT